MDFKCPECGDDKSTFGVKLMFSVCGHHVCEKCYKKMFRSNLEISCPICKKNLERKDFADKYQEDKEAEKDREIRKMIVSVFNRCKEDFGDISEYYDYLEMVEEFIDSLMKGRNEEEIKEKIEKEKEVRKGGIAKSEKRREKVNREFYKKAVLTDWVYNERWADEADLLLRDKREEEVVQDENFVMKVMPNKIDDESGHVEAMKGDIKKLFLCANGFDFNEIENTGIMELKDGLSRLIL